MLTERVNSDSSTTATEQEIYLYYCQVTTFGSTIKIATVQLHNELHNHARIW